MLTERNPDRKCCRWVVNVWQTAGEESVKTVSYLLVLRPPLGLMSFSNDVMLLGRRAWDWKFFFFLSVAKVCVCVLDWKDKKKEIKPR